MWQKIKNNPKIYHFMAYCYSFLCYGAILTGLGPLIPYLAQQQGVLQTQYSFLFFNRAIGFVIGSILVKIFQKRLTFHQILIIFSTLIFISLALFSNSNNMFMQGFYVLLGSIFCATTEIILNVCILVSNQGQDQQFYVQIGHGMFGIGGLISPFLVLWFEQYSYFLLGFAMFIAVPFYFYMKTPELDQQIKANQILQAGSIVDECQRISQNIQPHDKVSSFLRRKKRIIYLISFMFFIYIGQQVAYGGWISSYTVLQQVSNKQQATKFSSIFWIFMTIFRFVFAFVKISSSFKLKMLIYSQIIISLIIIILVDLMNMQLLASYLGSICYGISMSAMFGLFFVLPFQYGLVVTSEEGSSFLMYGELGEGTISMFVGYLMKWFTPTMLFYSIFICGCILLWSCNQVIKNLTTKSNSTESIEMKQLHQTQNVKQSKELVSPLIKQ